MKVLFSTLRLFFLLTLVTGILYPLLITTIAQYTMKEKANGTLIFSKGRVVGSALIAQKFEKEKYFWGRPSMCDYDPLRSRGSNLGPTSQKLKRLVEQRRTHLRQSRSSLQGEVPSDLLFASGSGLDPHISEEAAYFQIERVAKARHLNTENGKNAIKKLIELSKEKRALGEECVNLLKLNRALDEYREKDHESQ